MSRTMPSPLVWARDPPGQQVVPWSPGLRLVSQTSTLADIPKTWECHFFCFSGAGKVGTLPVLGHVRGVWGQKEGGDGHCP